MKGERIYPTGFLFVCAVRHVLRAIWIGIDAGGIALRLNRPNFFVNHYKMLLFLSIDSIRLSSFMVSNEQFDRLLRFLNFAWYS